MQCNVYVFFLFIHVRTDMVYHIYTAMTLYMGGAFFATVTHVIPDGA